MQARNAASVLPEPVGAGNQGGRAGENVGPALLLRLRRSANFASKPFAVRAGWAQASEAGRDCIRRSQPEISIFASCSPTAVALHTRAYNPNQFFLTVCSKVPGIEYDMADSLQKHYIFASDFDQTLTFNDSGYVLSELVGIPTEEFERKAKGMAKLNLVQQGAELAYLLLHDPEFRSQCAQGASSRGWEAHSPERQYRAALSESEAGN